MKDNDIEKNKTTMFAEIIPFASAGNVDTLTYSIPEHLEKNVETGSLVEIAIHGKRVKGVVKNFVLSAPPFQTKPLEIVLSKSILQTIHMDLWEKMTKEFFSSHQKFVPFFLPSHVRENNGKIPSQNFFLLKNFPEKTPWKKGETELFSMFTNPGDMVEKAQCMHISSSIRKNALENEWIAEVSIPNFSVQTAEISAQNDHPMLLAMGEKTEREKLEWQKMEETLQQGKQVFILESEYCSLFFLEKMVKEHFGSENVVVFHGKKTEKEKAEIFWDVQSGKKIVLGTMSAAFLPFVRLGLIIVHDFFDASYQMPLSPFFSGEKVAKILGKHWHANVFFSSHIASCEEIFSDPKEKKIVIFPKKFPPYVSVVNMETEVQNQKNVIISSVAKEATQKALAANEQIFFFLNRRGVHRAVVCKQCGHIPRSPFSGNVLGVFFNDKGEKILRCTETGYSENFPKICKECKGEEFVEMGKGTQFLEEILVKNFPNARMVRVDKDLKKTPSEWKEIFFDIAEKKYDIVVGTQMMLKNFSFPFLSTAIMMSVENDLCFPDFRAEERVFQHISCLNNLISSKTKNQHVILQTFTPSLPLFSFLSEEKKWDFFKKEYGIRKHLFLPPFSRFFQLHFSGKTKEGLEKKAKKMHVRLAEMHALHGKKLKIFPPLLHFDKLKQQWMARLPFFSEKTEENADLWQELQHFFGQEKVIVETGN